MKAYYDIKPDTFEVVGDGRIRYRYNKVEEDAPGFEPGDKPRKQWACEEVIVEQPMTANSVTEAVITARWDKNYEQKLINEYNAALMGMLDEAEKEKRISAYKAFLQERDRLKKMVDADFGEG